jgi:hypothetical protein
MRILGVLKKIVFWVRESSLSVAIHWSSEGKLPRAAQSNPIDECGFLMSMLKYMLLAGLSGLAIEAGAQTAYTVTENMALMGPAGPTMLTTIYRDGNRALLDQSRGPDKDNPQGYHVRTYNDLATHTSYSWDLIHAESGCGTGHFSGDWGDPFATSSSSMDELTKAGAKEAGMETVNGFAAKVWTVKVEGTAVKAWVDTKSGMLVKEQEMPAGGPPAVLEEVKQVSLTAPPAAVFALPASCTALGLPKVSVEDERVAAETAGHAGDYVRAIGVPEMNSAKGCPVVVRVVKAGTMEPITSGFQLAVDLTYDVNHPPSYVRGTGPNGKETVSGGGIRDVTALMKNGAYRIDNPPAYFNVESYWGDAGDAFALIYTQCFGPRESVLLFVVKDPSSLGKGGDWLWAKSGKFASK